jgi:tellurite resistance protein
MTCVVYTGDRGHCRLGTLGCVAKHDPSPLDAVVHASTAIASIIESTAKAERARCIRIVKDTECFADEHESQRDRIVEALENASL